MKKSVAQKIALAGVLVCLATVFGTFSIPLFGAKMSPVQHFVNVVMAVTLGPTYAVGGAFVSSLLRNIMGTGSLLAFPGSMIGAFLAGILYKKYERMEAALIGEVFGTGILGALVAYPIATLFLGKEVAMFVYVVPFLISCTGGSIAAYCLLKIPVIKKTVVLNHK